MNYQNDQGGCKAWRILAFLLLLVLSAGGQLVNGGEGANSVPVPPGYCDFVPKVFYEILVPATNLDEVKFRALKGDADSQVLLGGMFQTGKGVPEDFVEAIKWYKRAAAQGDLRAEVLLAGAFEDGAGVPKDQTEALRLLLRAAGQGNIGARMRLAVAYAEGDGAPKDMIEAYKWINLVLAAAKPVDFIRLQGVSLWGRRFAYINNETLAEGETFNLKSGLGKIQVKCLSIQSNGVDIQVVGEAASRRLVLSQVSYAEACSQLLDAAVKIRAVMDKNLPRASLLEAQSRSTDYAGEDKHSDLVSSNTAVLMDARGCATAFFITEDGYALTAFHAIKGAKKISLRTAQGTCDATVVASDSTNDLALLKASGKFEILPLQSSRDVRLGTSVFTVGYPNPVVQGLQPKLTRGEVSSLSGIGDDPRTFQISVPVQPGNSGGPLVNLHGNVVGIVASRLNDFKAFTESGSLPQNVNYAVKSSLALKLVAGFPDVLAKLTKTTGEDRKLEDLAQQAERSSALVLIY